MTRDEAFQRGCLNKKYVFNTKKEALQKAAWYNKQNKKYNHPSSLRPYRCFFCHKYHLTSQSKEMSKLHNQIRNEREYDYRMKKIEELKKRLNH